MELTRNNLFNAVEGAVKNKAKYFGVAIINEIAEQPQTEVIINTVDNMENGKLLYYMNAYTDNLQLKTQTKIRIAGFTYGNDANSITEDLGY